MKVGGVTLTPPDAVTVVIPRNAGDIVFKAGPILDYSVFETLCPSPTPPSRTFPGGRREIMFEDPVYVEAINMWAEQQTDWTAITSLRATEDLEWETVNYDDPATWKNYKKEFSEAGLSRMEQAAIFKAITDACGLTQDKIEEATKNFLAGLGSKPDTVSSPSSGLQNTPSGDPAKDSESDPQT